MESYSVRDGTLIEMAGQERCSLGVRLRSDEESHVREIYLCRKWLRDTARWRERTRELRGQEEESRDGERKDIDFHLKEAISASQELRGLSVCLRLCVCL